MGLVINPSRGIVSLCVLLVLAAGAAAAAGPAEARLDPWIFVRAGQDHFYNLEYDEAIRDFQKAIELDPQNASFYNYLATSYLFKQLYAAEYLDAGLFAATNDFLRLKRIEPDPALTRPFLDSLRRAKEISEQRLRANAGDVAANYTLGAAYGIEANYEFTINRRFVAALQRGSKAKQYHDRVIQLDPNYHDANLVRGVYEYIAGSIPGWIKWLAFLGGYYGTKEDGIILLQDAMTRGRYTTTDAAILLAVIYYREKQYGYVRQILTHLKEYYPHNSLLPLQIGLTYAREGDQQKALEIYERVAAQAESGYKLTALRRDKLFYQVGTMLERNGDAAQAVLYYDKIAGTDGPRGLVRAYAYLRKGEIYVGQKRTEQARQVFQAVTRMPYPEARQVALTRLKALEARAQ